jgi:hypothetical protein
MNIALRGTSQNAPAAAPLATLSSLALSTSASTSRNAMSSEIEARVMSPSTITVADVFGRSGDAANCMSSPEIR